MAARVGTHMSTITYLVRMFREREFFARANARRWCASKALQKPFWLKH